MSEMAPELDVVAWLNTADPIRLADVRGKVVVLEAFQMLCPGCAQLALPQLARVHAQFDPSEVIVLGLHTVFEHHEVQGGREPLSAFLDEYGYNFPVGIDRPLEGGLPSTVAAYGMRGTPTLHLIDREGRLRRQIFGHIPDLRLGAEIMALAVDLETDGPMMVSLESN